MPPKRPDAATQCLRFHGGVKEAAPASRAPRRMRNDEREWLGRAKVLPKRAASAVPRRAAAAAGDGWTAAGKVLTVSELMRAAVRRAGLRKGLGVRR